jgi:lysophospholipase L1-like esterase
MNMKLHCLLVPLVICTSVIAQDISQEAPMPVLPTALPAGVNPAAYPAGRFEWFEKVQRNINAGNAVAANCQMVFDGDSITENWQNFGRQIWAQRYEKFNAVDFGIGGDRTQNLLWRLSHGQGAGLHPKLVVLMIGANNIRMHADQIEEGVTAVVKSYQKYFPDAVILLQGILPRNEKADDPLRATAKQVNKTIAKLDDGKHVIFIDFGSKFLQPDGSISREIMPDFLHPSEKGYQIWADAIQPFIDRYLGSK